MRAIFHLGCRLAVVLLIGSSPVGCGDSSPEPVEKQATHERAPLEGIDANTLLLRLAPKVPTNVNWNDWHGSQSAQAQSVEQRFGKDLAQPFLVAGVNSARPLGLPWAKLPPELVNVFELTWKPTKDAPTLSHAVAALAKLSAVDVVEYNPVYTADFFPSDPVFSQQWHLHSPDWVGDINAPEAWDITRGKHRIVAVLDTGIDETHPDLAGRVIPGWDFIDGDADARDEHGHGTHVAGIIAAQADGWGSVGVDPSAYVVAIRVLGADGVSRGASVLEGVRFAASSTNAVIQNLSLGGAPPSAIMEAALRYAWEVEAQLIVCSAGNDGVEEPHYPAAYETTVSVAAIDGNGATSGFSNRGYWVDISAPGYAIWSTRPYGGHVSKSGTSQAAPIVSAAASLVLQPGFADTPHEAFQFVSAGAGPVVTLHPDLRAKGGLGTVDLLGTLTRGPKPTLKISDLTLFDPFDEAIPHLIPGATMTIEIELKSMSANVAGIIATLSTSSPYVTVGAPLAHYGDLPFWRRARNSSERFVIHVDPNVPREHRAVFDLTLDHASGTNNVDFSLAYPWEHADGFPRELNSGWHIQVEDVDSDGRKEMLVLEGGMGYYADTLSLIDDDGSDMPHWPLTVAVDHAGTPAVVRVGTGHGIFWVDVTGVLHGVDITGAALSGFPINLALFAPIAGSRGQVAIDDLDKDGNIDIFVLAHNGAFPAGDVHAFLFDASGSLWPGWPVRLATLGYDRDVISSPTLADIDADGVRDIVLGSSDRWPASVLALRLDGSRVWPDAGSDGDMRFSSLAADFDGDGLLETVAVYDGSSLVLLDSTGTPKPRWPPRARLMEPGAYSWEMHVDRVAVGDVHPSPGLELVAVGSVHAAPLGHRVWVIAQDGTVLTRIADTGPSPDLRASLAIADITGDGFEEIVITKTIGWPREMYAWSGDGTPVDGFPLHHEIFQPTVIVVADMDGDGQGEVVQTDAYGLDVIHFRTPLTRLSWGGKNKDSGNTRRLDP